MTNTHLDAIDQQRAFPEGPTVGVPTELKDNEYRVAITPDGVAELAHRGVRVLVQSGAGAGAEIGDDEFAAAGALLIDDAAELWERSSLVCKVKEPETSELDHMRPGLVVFTYLHLAANPSLAAELAARGVTAIAYETVQLADGSLPLLTPMSEVAGRMATQIGAHHLQREHGGRGVLLGGAPGVRPGRVVVLGAGNVGWNAAWIAAGMESEVLLFDRNLDRLRWVDQIHHGRIMTLASNHGAIARAVAGADLVIGAVLVAGGRAPVVVTTEMVASMRPRSVIVDVAVDQNNCIETTHETTHAEPTYESHGVIHYAVGNIPGAVPHTSTYALTNATLPYLIQLAASSDQRATLLANPPLMAGVNVHGGSITHPNVAAATGADYVPVEDAFIR